MPDNIIIVKTYKEMGADNVLRSSWYNEYLFHTEIPLDRLYCDYLAGILLQFERGFHLRPVHFSMTVINTFGSYMKKDNKRSTFITNFMDGGWYGAVDVTEALGLEFGFYCTKSVAGGHSGKMLYRGCLNKTDVVVGHKDRWALKSPRNFENAMFDYGDLFRPNDLVTFVMTQRRNERMTDGDFKAVSNFRAQGVQESRAFTRRRLRLKSPPLTIKGKIEGAALMARRSWDKVNAWAVLGVAYNPKELKEDGQFAVESAYKIAQDVLDYLDGKQFEGDGKTVPDESRYGPTKAETRSFVNNIRNKTDADREFLDNLEMWVDFDGEKYVALEAMPGLLDLIQDKVSQLGDLLHYDWLNPYTVENEAAPP